MVNAVDYLKYILKFKKNKKFRVFTQLVLSWSFNKATKKLKKDGWFSAIVKFTQTGKPFWNLPWHN